MSLSRRGSSSATRTVCFLVVMGTFRTTRCSSNCDVCGFGQAWQREFEDAALAFACALRPDPPSVRFDESLTDSQSEPGPADHTRHLAVYAVEPIEDSIELYGWHSKTLVGPRHTQIPPFALRREVDTAAIWRVLYGVGEQILHHLVNASLIRVH